MCPAKFTPCGVFKGTQSKFDRLPYQMIASLDVRGDDPRAMNHWRCVRTLRRFLGEVANQKKGKKQ